MTAILSGLNGRGTQPAGGTLWRLRRNKLGLVALSIIGFYIVVAVLAPIITPFADQGRGTPDLPNRLMAPNSTNWLGTDDLGRDVLARLLFGARTALLIAFGVVSVSVVIGVVIGATAGYFGKWVDEVLMRITDMFLAFPPLLLAVIVAASLGPSTRNTVIAITVSWWPWYARQIRTQVLSLRERPYVKSAQALGVPDYRVIGQHIIPNAMTPVWVQATADLGAVILVAAGLSFVGLGTRPPGADWGLMIEEGRSFVLAGQWWIAGSAGVAVTVLALAFNLIGDVVHEITDPKADQ